MTARTDISSTACQDPCSGNYVSGVDSYNSTGEGGSGPGYWNQAAIGAAIAALAAQAAAEAQQAAQQSCTVSVLGTPALFNHDPFQQTITAVRFATGQTDFLEGYPVPHNPSNTSLTAPMWLNGFDSAQPIGTLLNKVEWTSSESLQVCDTLLGAVYSYQQNLDNAITYNNKNPWAVVHRCNRRAVPAEPDAFATPAWPSSIL